MTKTSYDETHSLMDLSLLKQYAEHLTDPDETPHSERSHLETHYTKTVRLLSLFKQYAEHLTVLIEERLLTLRDLIRVSTDQTSHVRTLELSLFTQYAAHLTAPIQVRLLTREVDLVLY